MGIDFNNPPPGSDVYETQRDAREIENRALSDLIAGKSGKLVFVVSECSKCPWFYMDDAGTLTLCRRTHVENDGPSYYWKHVRDPMKMPSWCPIKTPKNKVSKL